MSWIPLELSWNPLELSWNPLESWCFLLSFQDVLNLVLVFLKSPQVVLESSQVFLESSQVVLESSQVVLDSAQVVKNSSQVVLNSSWVVSHSSGVMFLFSCHGNFFSYGILSGHSKVRLLWNSNGNCIFSAHNWGAWVDWQEKEICPLDWRTTMHRNIVPEIF